MTKDDIIKLAWEAGLERVVELREDGTRTTDIPHPDLLKRFAAIVAAAERAACAQVCEDLIGTRAMARHCADAIRAKAQS